MALKDLLIKPSTRAYFRQSMSLGRYGLTEWLHGYVYARWIYLYIGIGTGAHPVARRFKPAGRALVWLFQRLTGLRGKTSAASGAGRKSSFADSYHGKVVPLENARRLITVEQPVRLPDLEKIVPYSRARDIVLDHPGEIAVMTCPCRAVRQNPCHPLEVCLIVGEPFVGFVLEHHPDRARRIDSREAVTILEAENRRGHVSHAFFKDAMLDRFYAICNCCSCCCGAMQAQRNGVPMLASSGYVCVADQDRCTGCATCVELCQFNALSMAQTVVVDTRACMGCGVCCLSCPAEVLSLVRDPSRGEPLEIDRLLEACVQEGPKKNVSPPG